MSERIVDPPFPELYKDSNIISPHVVSLVDLLHNSSLTLSWEIYAAPNLNGLKPDLVLLNPNRGLAIYLVILGIPSEGDLAVGINSLINMKYEITDLYCPNIGKISGLKAIDTFLVLPDLIGEDLKKAREYVFDSPRKEKFWGYVVGKESYDKVEQLYPRLKGAKEASMRPELADDFRSWLVEPDFSKINRHPPNLDAKQKSLVIEPIAPNRRRRIRGAAGSGKSLILASRAANLAVQGKKVLVATYNITMINYLREVAFSWPVPQNLPVIDNITWLNYHHWCKRTVSRTKYYKEYKELWMRRKSGVKLDKEEAGRLDEILQLKMPELTQKAILSDTKGSIPRYDVIMVDEGQDYCPQWWITLSEVLAPDGEMLFVADPSQNIYGRDLSFTHGNKMGSGSFAGMGAGFTGPWMELNASYRLPPKLIPILEDYIAKFLPNSDVVLPKKEENKGSLFKAFPFEFNWINVPADQGSAEVLVNAAMDMPSLMEKNILAIPDIVIITDKKRVGEDVVKLLAGKNIQVAHTFEDGDNGCKMSFSMNKAPIKITTIHSFKGWESRSIILYISNTLDDRALAAVYVGLSRVKRHEGGSSITVVSASSKLNSFGGKWAAATKKASADTKHPIQKLELKWQQNIVTGKPRNAGLPWTSELKRELAKLFTDGKTVEVLATHFERTTRAITSELQHQGLIEDPS